MIFVFSRKATFTVPGLHYSAPAIAIMGYSYEIVGLPVMECSSRPCNVVVVAWCMAMYFGEGVAKKKKKKKNNKKGFVIIVHRTRVGNYSRAESGFCKFGQIQSKRLAVAYTVTQFESSLV